MQLYVFVAAVKIKTAAVVGLLSLIQCQCFLKRNALFLSFSNEDLW